MKVKDRVKVYANSFSFLDFFPNIMDLIYHVKITVLLTVELIVQISTKWIILNGSHNLVPKSSVAMVKGVFLSDVDRCREVGRLMGGWVDGWIVR